jgi:hypothetical protein
VKEPVREPGFPPDDAMIVAQRRAVGMQGATRLA